MDSFNKLIYLAPTSLTGWLVQSKKQIHLSAGVGVAIREYQTDIGPADYILFVDTKPVGFTEAKREEEVATLFVFNRKHLYNYSEI